MVIVVLQNKDNAILLPWCQLQHKLSMLGEYIFLYDVLVSMEQLKYQEKVISNSD